MHEWHVAGGVLSIGARPLVLGIVNVTPDSFSDGGRFASTDAAVAHGLDLLRQGADLLDVGGESSRPGAMPVPVDEELSRVVPVVARLAAHTTAPISVDTCKAEVARASIAAGAAIINDIRGLADAFMPEVVRSSDAGVILMHMQGTPATMQQAPHYEDVVEDVAAFFEERLLSVAALGIASERVVLDPGIGFGKTRAHNLQLLARLHEFQRFRRPVCLGVSRKGFLGRMLGERPVERRLAASLAATCFAMSRQAVQLVRVHDVEETRDAVTLFAALGEQA